MIGIISYLPDDIKLREIRYRCATMTIEFLHSIFPNEKINVVDQNWSDEERGRFDYVRFYYEPNGINMSNARNVMLKEFYTSTDTWMVMSDDDTVLYDYYDAKKFLHDLYYGKYDNYPIDLLVPLSPQLSPFKERLIKADVANYYIFSASRLTDIPNFMVLKNTEKHILYNEETDPRKREEKTIPEDAEFIMNQMLAGKKCVVADFMIKKNLAYNDSTIFPEESSTDYTFHKKLNDNLKSYILKNYKIESRYFTKCYNKAIAFRIKRDSEYILPENLVKVSSKGRSNKSCKLF